MGVAYHARHIVWLDIARTEHLRRAGFSYRELEAQGLHLVVTDLRIRYRAAARYDDLVRIRCRVAEAGSRRVTFSYELELEPDQVRVADAETSLVCLDRRHRVARLPEAVVRALGGGREARR